MSNWVKAMLAIIWLACLALWTGIQHEQAIAKCMERTTHTLSECRAMLD